MESTVADRMSKFVTRLERYSLEDERRYRMNEPGDDATDWRRQG